MTTNCSPQQKRVGTKIKSQCALCARETNHVVLYQFDCRHDDPDDESGIWGETQHIICQCQGCDSVTYRLEDYFSENYSYTHRGEVELVPEIEIYPSRLPERKKLDGYQHAPRNIVTIYNETYSALCNTNKVLSGIGIRAIIEAVCKAVGASGPTLQKKIDKLHEGSHITENERDYLHDLRFMGNDAAHEIKAHDMDDLLAALEIAEHLIKRIYILPKIADRLKKTP